MIVIGSMKLKLMLKSRPIGSSIGKAGKAIRPTGPQHQTVWDVGPRPTARENLIYPSLVKTFPFNLRARPNENLGLQQSKDRTRICRPWLWSIGTLRISYIMTASLVSLAYLHDNRYPLQFHVSMVPCIYPTSRHPHWYHLHVSMATGIHFDFLYKVKLPRQRVYLSELFKELYGNCMVCSQYPYSKLIVLSAPLNRAHTARPTLNYRPTWTHLWAHLYRKAYMQHPHTISK